MCSGSPCTTRTMARRRAPICRSRSNSFTGSGESPAKRKAADRIVGIDTLQCCACLLGVFSHLHGERLRRGENLVGAEEGDELGLHLLAVKVPGKIEEIGLEHGLVFAEGRAHADISSSMRTSAVMVDAH